MRSALLGAAILAGLLVCAGKAAADVAPGCTECLGTCQEVNDGSFGLDFCNDGQTGSIGMETGVDFDCNQDGGQVCYKTSTEVTVTAEHPCDFFEWIFFGCPDGGTPWGEQYAKP